MTTLISAATLFTVETASSLLEFGLSLARVAGLPVTTWQPGDPTLSCYKYLAEVLATLESANSEYIKAGFLEDASGDWLTVLAWNVYGVPRTEATYASPTLVLVNQGGMYYEFVPGALTVRCSATQKTFTNTSAGVLDSGVGETCELDFVADEAGSDSTVALNEVDEIVTSLIDVEIDSSTAAAAEDEQSDASLKAQCEATRGALSPNGPADAYEYVVRNPDLTGVTDITRAKTAGDNETLEVTIYVAGPSGPVAGASVDAAQTAVEQWATPLCVTPTVINADTQAVNVTAAYYGDGVTDDTDDTLAAALDELFAATDIGGTIPLSLLISTLHNTLRDSGVTNPAVILSTPSSAVVLAAGTVPVAGTISITQGA